MAIRLSVGWAGFFVACAAFAAGPAPVAAAEPGYTGLAATDLSARHRQRARRAHRHYRPHVRITEVYAVRPYKYDYAPSYRLYPGSAYYFRPAASAWPYKTPPYPHTHAGFGFW